MIWLIIISIVLIAGVLGFLKNISYEEIFDPSI